MTLTLSRPSASEAPAFAALHVACWKETYRGIVPDGLLDAVGSDDRLELWNRALVDPTRIAVGAYDGGLGIGFVLAGTSPETLATEADGHVFALYVRYSHQRQGIGRRLMAEAATAWVEQGGRSLSVAVLAANWPARHFYEALGGRLSHECIDFWSGYELPEVVYVFDGLSEIASFA